MSLIIMLHSTIERNQSKEKPTVSHLKFCDSTNTDLSFVSSECHRTRKSVVSALINRLLSSSLCHKLAKSPRWEQAKLTNDKRPASVRSDPICLSCVLPQWFFAERYYYEGGGDRHIVFWWPWRGLQKFCFVRSKTRSRRGLEDVTMRWSRTLRL